MANIAGAQYLVGPGQTVFSVAEDLQLQPFDIVKFNIDINPAYTLLEGSVLTVPCLAVRQSLLSVPPKTSFFALMLIPSLVLRADTKTD